MKRIQNSISLYFQPRVFAMAILGFPYGMMYYLAIATLQVWLKEEGVDITTLGFFAWVSLPYTLKFLWAPFIGYIKVPLLGHYLGNRRGWLVLAHVGLMILLAVLANTDPAACLPRTVALAVGLLFFAGIQDIVVDAYRIEILSKDQSGPGIGMLTAGYRCGSLMASAGAYYLAEKYGWTVSYECMSVLVLMGVIAALMNPEPKVPINPIKGFFKGHVLPPIRNFFERPGWLEIMMFVILYRVGDAMMNNMLNIFYLDMGFNKIEIADVTKTFGMVPAVIGGLVGGALAVKHNIFRLLLWGGVFHALSHAIYGVQAHLGYNIHSLYLFVFFEKITNGFLTAVFLTYLSRQVSWVYAATQYAFLSSLWSVSTMIAGFGGLLVEALDHQWSIFFVISALISIPSLIMIHRLQRFGFMNDGPYRR